MWTKRRSSLRLLAGLALAGLTSFARAGDIPVQQPGVLRIAVYNDFAPYSAKGQGIDVDLGRALAEKLGLKPDFVWFSADDDMGDDLRNMVWKGHYLGTRPADVMMHVPVDTRLAQANKQVTIFAPYYLETLAVVRDPQRVPPVSGSAAVALEVFTREKIGVEVGSLADSFLLASLSGRIRDQVVHYRSVAKAVGGLRAGEVAAVMAPKAELEAALGSAPSAYAMGPVKMPEMRINGWALGLAVKADNPQLADTLGQAMVQLEKDGTVKQIFARHGVTHQTTGD